MGAGPAGSALAITLAQAGIPVLLTESTRFEKPRVGELLSPQGQPTIEALLPNSRDFLVTPIGVVGAWASERIVRFSRSMSWWSMHRTALDEALALRAEELGADLRLGTRMKNFERHRGGWRFELVGDHPESEFFADWLVDASGRGCSFARSQGAYRHRLDRQIGLVGFLRSDPDVTLPPEMFLEAVEDGWWYSAPIGPGEAVATYVTDSDLDRGKPLEAWTGALSRTHYLRERLIGFELSELPRRVSAENSILLGGHGRGWVAVGDAASSFDPFSNHGVGRAAAEGVRLGEVFVQAHQNSLPVYLGEFFEEMGSAWLDTVSALADAFRQVHRWPGSTFWSRRMPGPYSEESLVRTSRKALQQRKLIFPKGQLFECNRCGKCCASAWAPEVEPPGRERIGSSYLALKVASSKDRLPLTTRTDGRVEVAKDDRGICVFLDDDSSCRLHQEGEHFKPVACQQFPFLFRDTPEGTVVGVSFLCSSIQQNTGRPLEDYSEDLMRLLSHRKPMTIPRQVALTWGRSLDWETYKGLEEKLMLADGVAATARIMRWHIALWTYMEDAPPLLTTDFPDDTPMPFLYRLESILSLSLIAKLEDSEEHEDLLGDLLESRAVRLPRSDWEGHVQSLPTLVPIDQAPWLFPEIDRYLRALVQRKFLLVQTPLLSNLCLLSSLPYILVYYTCLYSLKNGKSTPTREDFYRALDLVELELVTHSRLELPTRMVVSYLLEAAANPEKFMPPVPESSPA